jgi:uncharacterized protein
MTTLQEKNARLQEVLLDLGRVLVAYSGGVDSAYLAWAAHRIPGLKMLAILADSPSRSRHHFADAVRFSHPHQIPIEIIKTVEMDNPEYVRNDSNRCFHCKNELFTRMEEAKARLSPNIGVVNIDNGFGAACLAHSILNVRTRK